jgi:murein hydrolase activator
MMKRMPTVLAISLLAALLLAAPATIPHAQEAPEEASQGTTQDGGRQAPGPQPESARDMLIEQRGAAIRQLETITRSLSISQETRARLKADVAAIKADEAAISGELIKAAAAEKAMNAEIAVLTEKLALLGTETQTLRASLRERSDVLAGVLAALQRLGRNPPPALLVTPQDALASVRSAVLLGAVVPAMRLETMALKTDLERLTVINAATQAATADLTTRLRRQIEDQARLGLLLEEKRNIGARSTDALSVEGQRVEELQSGLAGLQALLDSIDRQIADVETAAAKRRAALETARAIDPGSFEIGPAVSFASLKGELPFPADGVARARFGERNDAGVVMNGDTIETRSAAIVTAPADAVVAFAAPFRSYRNLVILDTGGGYKLVLGGMAQLGVTVGQTVLAGEPVGVMPAGSAGSPADKASLYVELRKDGQPMDPRAWWREPAAGRTTRLSNDDA